MYNLFRRSKRSIKQDAPRIDLVSQGSGPVPYADVLPSGSLESSLIAYMRDLFERYYDKELAGTLHESVVAGQKVAARFNRRGTEFLGVAAGSVLINGHLVETGAIVRIDPGEIVEIRACEDAELVSHVFPFRQALVRQQIDWNIAPQKNTGLPLVSLVIIGRDVEHHICQAILGGIEQTHSNMQIIVVDDGSSDGTADKCRSMAYFDPRIEVHVQPLGRNGVRAFGARQAKGEYCLIIDGDDWLNRDAVEKLVGAAQQGSSECVVFGFDHVSDKTSVVWNPVYPTDVHLLSPPMYYNQDAKSALWVSHLNHTIWMYFFSTRIKQEIIDSLINIDLYEDIPFYFAIVQNAKQPILWNEVLYHYRRDRVGQSTAEWHKVRPAQKIGSLEISVDRCLQMVGKNLFLNLILIYKVRRIVDHELHLCNEEGDALAVAAWEQVWRSSCQKFSQDVALDLADERVKRLFVTAIN